jgi:hypothetical protein
MTPAAVARWALRLLAAAALAIDAYTHADLAPDYDAITNSISQGDLFRIEAGVASLAALLLMISGSRIVWAFAFLVLASGLGALLLYRYVNVGELGPLPNMYEPVWYPEKSTAAIAEAAGVVITIVGFIVGKGKRGPRKVSRAAAGSRT